MAIAKLPDPTTPFMDADGRPSREFYEFLLSLHRIKLGDITNVDLTTPPTNGQQLTFVSAAGKWKPGVA